MTLAELSVGASSSQTCSLLLGQQKARALLAVSASSAVPDSYSVSLWQCDLKQKNVYLSLSTKHGGVRISTTTQYKNIDVIFEQLVMLAFPLSVCNISRAWIKYKNMLGFIKGVGPTVPKGESSHELTWTRGCPATKTKKLRSSMTTHREGVWRHSPV